MTQKQPSNQDLADYMKYWSLDLTHTIATFAFFVLAMVNAVANRHTDAVVCVGIAGFSFGMSLKNHYDYKNGKLISKIRIRK